MNEFDRNNSQLWKWGIIYYNHNDDKLIVPKKTGLGWTFNFAHRNIYLFLAALIVIIVLAVRYLK